MFVVVFVTLYIFRSIVVHGTTRIIEDVVFTVNPTSSPTAGSSRLKLDHVRLVTMRLIIVSLCMK